MCGAELSSQRSIDSTAQPGSNMYFSRLAALRLMWLDVFDPSSHSWQGVLAARVRGDLLASKPS
eukprot:COSAG06_NODE_23375_length_694_cov_0.763025_1_plen_64_part_00